jgi:RHS repeat-associated protein
MNSGYRYDGSQLQMGRFLSPDPGGVSVVNPTNPQSWNMYSYALNNPLTNTDPTGLDCVYFNNEGNAAESVDHNSNSGECGANGGDWVNGTTSASQIQYNVNNDTFSIQSSSFFHAYDTTASAPGSQTNGTMCYGNCDTPTGYSSSFSLANLQSSAYSVSGFQSLSTLILPVGGIPVPIASLGWSPTVTYIPKTNTVCAGAAVGVSTGTGKTLSATVYPSSDAQFSKAVTSEWGWNLNAQPAPGAGVSVNTNSSGSLVGYTVASNAGASATYGYTWCKDF